MELIGGLVFWDPARGVAQPTLEAMGRKVPGVGAMLHARSGSVGLFSSLGAGSINATDHLVTVADLDLTNRPELQALTGVTGSDGELLAALHAMEGPGFVRRLRGAFAFALWDPRQRTLLAAVDHFGIRRLHYVTDRDRTAFASRPGALLAAGVDGRVDLSAVFQYVNFGYVPAPGSILAGVVRLPPGHSLRVSQGDARLERYWDMRYPEQAVPISEGARRLARLTEEAVARTLRGTTPKEAGAFLSGGTDSSAVVGLMGRLTSERANAFSIGFQEPRYDELGYAELAARHFEATHYVKILTPDAALEALPRLVEAYDEPLGNNSAIGTLACARLARECGIRHLLAGDGGDEIFGGNERYTADRVFARYHLVPLPVRRRLLEPVFLNLPDRGPLGRVQRYIRRANIPNPRRFYSYEFFFAQEAQQLLDPDFARTADLNAPWNVVQEHFDRVEAGSELNRLMYLDLKLTIGDNDLLKVTRTAELAGVAVRFPLLDLSLVEFTGTLPANMKVRGLEKRYLFKRAFRTLLPPQTLAKRKHGFGVPTSVWLKSHPGFQALARETLLSSRARQRGYFRPGAIDELFRLHAADTTPFYGDILWTLLMLELWHRQHLDQAVSS
jgi:asparagine synthase (glutamine-hydrolysing)